MDTVKFLLGATAALLLGAIVLSWRGMRDGVSKAPSDEIAKLQAQIDELNRKIDAGKGGGVTAPPVNPHDPTHSRPLQDPARDPLNPQNDPAAMAKLQRDEEGLIAQKLMEAKDKNGELKRARIIAQALLIGKVKEYKEDPQYGDFISFEMLMPEQVQVGGILGVRRKTGILAQFKVSDIYPDGAIAHAVSPIGPIKPEPGDELIFPPLF